MWKIGPRNLKTSDPAARRFEAAVLELEKNWRQWLAAALVRGQNRSPDPARAVEELLNLSGRRLLQLDPVFRYGYWQPDGSSPGSDRVVLTEISRDRPDADAHLFVAACNPNGFVREHALRTYRHYPGGLALAAALIRCDDWVQPVREAARSLLDVLFTELPSALLFRYLDLLLILKDRERFSAEAWAAVEARLIGPEARSARWDAPSHLPSTGRRFAYELILRAEPARRLEALERAAQDSHVRVARWSMRELSQTSDGADARRFLFRALDHPHAAVRLEALRGIAQSRDEQAHGAIVTALLDRSRAVRLLAALLLNERFGESALSVWRDACSKATGTTLRVAVIALAESAEQRDLPLLAARARDPRPVVRAAVLRGLWRLNARDLSARLHAALVDPAKSVVREALFIFQRGSAILSPGVIEDALRAAPVDATKPLLVHGAARLEKWDALLFFLGQSTNDDPNVHIAALQELGKWEVRANRRFTLATAHTKERLRSALRMARTRHPERDWAELDRIVALA